MSLSWSHRDWSRLFAKRSSFVIMLSSSLGAAGRKRKSKGLHHHGIVIAVVCERSFVFGRLEFEISIGVLSEFGIEIRSRMMT